MTTEECAALRSRLVDAALSWQRAFGVAPAITSALSEFDAAMLVGCVVDNYCTDGALRTAVTKGHDFISAGVRYQVKANRPSGKRGSKVTLVAKPTNYDWDRLVWLLYNERYDVVEAWEWNVADYETTLGPLGRISPEHMRRGRRLL